MTQLPLSHRINAAASVAPRVSGKFLEADGSRFLVKGVTYGTFAPDSEGRQFPTPARIDEDFRLMVEAGVNTVRVYTVPTTELLDAAASHGLRVIVGVPWSQHVAFLSDTRLIREIRQQAAATVKRLASHPATFLFAVGNEIPAEIVRWHGERRVEHFLGDLYDACKQAVPSSVLTYVNFPPTEHLDVDCYDVCGFNLYLHEESELRAYLARLQHVAGSKPLLLAEAGADSLREGLDEQARVTAMHARVAFEEGACGAVAFAWTDEWWRGGHAVDDWAFGLVDKTRGPKPALAALSRAFTDAPFPVEDRATWPKVSVVVCAFNAADTLDECLTSLAALNYSDVELIVVNDGSGDATGLVARTHAGVHVIDVPNGGLSAARNVGLAHASGEIVAYTDADVRVDQDWLTYLVQPLRAAGFVGAGGPNVVPPDDDWVAQSVARAPGGPTHVLLDDREAEHVPGCNMAFRRDALLSIGGFNSAYLRAGDDVDICWRFQALGLRIGFAPSALVWHHHRSTVSAYWRQQVGYGEGETWLDAHHPDKFVGGQMLWRGHIYSPLPFLRRFQGRRVNTGIWGTAAFPSVYGAQAYRLEYLPHSPAWMVGALILLVSGVAGMLFDNRAAPLPLLMGLAGFTTTFVRCLSFARRSDLDGLPAVGTWTARQSRLAYLALIAWLHVIHPFARLRGRVRGMSSMPHAAPKHMIRRPWKAPFPRPSDAGRAAWLFTGRSHERSFWSETWASRNDLLTELVGVLRAGRPAPVIDIDEGWRHDRDISVAVGRWGWLHVRVLVEEHEQRRCLFRVGTRLRLSVIGTLQALTLAVLLLGGSLATMSLHQPSGRLLLLLAATVLITRTAWQTARSTALLSRALAQIVSTAGMVALPAEPETAGQAASPVQPSSSEGAQAAPGA